MTSAKLIGDAAEDLAAEYLLAQGLKLVQRNFYSRFGELDLIMRDEDSLVFVEVKQRRAGINHAIESITPAKQRKMVKTAQFYLLKLGRDVNCRFDAVVINELGQVEWLKNIIIL
ncbi:MAG: YraN family protein [Neisseriaceae bacterium]|nr:MAG: YraN family protein [Neisseriaceae bacterium]